MIYCDFNNQVSTNIKMTDKDSENTYRKEDPRFRIKTSQQMAASCTGALITSLTVTPLDVIKVRIQAQQKNLLSSKCFLYCNGLMDHLCPCVTSSSLNAAKLTSLTAAPRQTPLLFTGTVDALLKISRSEGVGSLWSGLAPTLVLAVPATVVYFTTYEQLRLYFKDRYRGVQPVWGPMAAGATSRLIAVTIVSPLELVRTKMQSKRVSYRELGQAIKSLLQRHGPKGLFKGLGSTLLRDVPFSAIYWLHYEYFKALLMETSEPTFWMSFTSGALAGSIAAVITTPFDVVKTHQQIELGEKEIYSDPAKKGGSRRSGRTSRSRGTLVLLRQIYMHNGVSGLFSGLVPRVVKVAPACAIMISTFEYGKLFFHRYNMEHNVYFD